MGDFKAVDTGEIIFGYSTRNHRIEGLGADDKNGIFICLEALRQFDCVKTVFFREEETGCRGSSDCDMDFFDDCRFVIQCDRKGSSDIITSIGLTELCSDTFLSDADSGSWGYRIETGLMTDVVALKENGLSVSAVNLSCAYYNPHTSEEITVKADLEKCWLLVSHIIRVCRDVYPHEPKVSGFGPYDMWEIEEELYTALGQDPALTGFDLYRMYGPCFPGLTKRDFDQVVESFGFFYDSDESVSHKNINDNEENNREEGIGF